MKFKIGQQVKTKGVSAPDDPHRVRFNTTKIYTVTESLSDGEITIGKVGKGMPCYRLNGMYWWVPESFLNSSTKRSHFPKNI